MRRRRTRAENNKIMNNLWTKSGMESSMKIVGDKPEVRGRVRPAQIMNKDTNVTYGI